MVWAKMLLHNYVSHWSRSAGINHDNNIYTRISCNLNMLVQYLQQTWNIQDGDKVFGSDVSLNRDKFNESFRSIQFSLQLKHGSLWTCTHELCKLLIGSWLCIPYLSPPLIQFFHFSDNITRTEFELMLVLGLALVQHLCLECLLWVQFQTFSGG